MSLPPGIYSLGSEKPNDNGYFILGETSCYLDTGSGRKFNLIMDLRFISQFLLEQGLLATDTPVDFFEVGDPKPKDFRLLLKAPPTGRIKFEAIYR